MIEAENLVKRYGSHTAVDHLSFRVEEGQIYGFLGPNGAGKSTTMNMLTGYLAATEGTVKINGFDMIKQPEEAKSCIGYLPEQPPLYQEMTVGEYLRFSAELKKIKKEHKKAMIQEAMELTMISAMDKRLIRNLSKGYKQRVGLAQAILGNPAVIILDEPTVGLDPKQIIEIRDLIKRLREKHTVILSSHILSEVSAICDKIMIISNGKLVACDTPAGLQHLQSGTAQIDITVLAEEKEAAPAFAQIEGIRQIRYETLHEGDLHITIETEQGVDIRREAAVQMAEHKLPVMAMSCQEKSLEAIFLALTAADRGEEEEQNESDM